MSDSVKPLSPDEMLGELNNNQCVAFKIFDEKVGKSGVKAVYCFVEGYDMPYYLVRVETAAGMDSEFIDCGGKKGVLKVFDFIANKPAYSKYKTLYFVDKDYDDNSSVPGKIFVTDGYSVENYYGSEKAIKKFFKGLCNINSEKEEEIEKVVDWYKKWKDDFIKATSLFCAWYANTKNRPDRKLVAKGDLKYKKSFPSRYAEISGKGIILHGYTLDDLNADYQIENPVLQSEIDNARSFIVTLDDIRGKYVMQLIEEFINTVKTDAASKQIYFSNPFNFEKDNTTLLSRLSFVADTSDSLRNYLKHNL